MTNDDDPSDLRCERSRLLMSLDMDAETTPERHEELAAHLRVCADCRAATRVDSAVRERVQEPAEVPRGFSARVMDAVRRQKLAARAQNRFVLATAAAAALFAVTFHFVLAGGGETPEPTSARARAGEALTAAKITNRNIIKER